MVGKPKKWLYVSVHAVLIVAVIIAVIPLLWMFSISIRSPRDAFGISLEGPFTLDNYIAVFNQSALFFGNSLIVAGSSTIVALLFGILTGYGMARSSFKGKSLVNTLVMSTRMFPPVLLALGFFDIIARVGLYDSRISLVLMNTLFVMPFAIWMMQSYFRAIPVEIDEAGLIDGCSRGGVLFRLVLPVSTPGLVATLVYAFLLSWNEYLFAVTFIQSTNRKAATVALAEIMGEWWTHYPRLMAMSVLISLPIMVLFLLVQKHLVSGLASSSIKG
mgnify:CR=1 FL=1